MTRFSPTLIEVRKLVGKQASSIHIHLKKEVVHKASFDRRFHSDLGCKLIGDTENSITTNIKPPKTTKNIKPVRLRGCPSDLVSAVNTSSATETSFIDTQCHCSEHHHRHELAHTTELRELLGDGRNPWKPNPLPTRAKPTPGN